MNFKKWFGRSKRDEDAELERIRKVVETLPKPRAQHYTFAHRALPSIASQMGAISVLILSDPERGSEFLHEVWDDCGQSQTGRDLVEPDGLGATVTQTKDKLIAVVTLPQPEVAPEAHFVAILSGLPPETEDEDDEVSEEAHEVLRLMLRSMPIRYFALEKGMLLDGTAYTVFCEWTSEGSHLNMGDGPPPTEEAFLEFLVAQNFPPVRASFDPHRDRPVQEENE